MSPMPVRQFDRLGHNYVSLQPSHNLPSESQENYTKEHGAGEQKWQQMHQFLFGKAQRLLTNADARLGQPEKRPVPHMWNYFCFFLYKRESFNKTRAQADVEFTCSV